MGDWQNIMSMNGDYSPWDSPCWNDDWEHELRDDGYLTVQGWNALGKIVKKGEKGMFLPCARIMVFRESQTEPAPENCTTCDPGQIIALSNIRRSGGMGQEQPRPVNFTIAGWTWLHRQLELQLSRRRQSS